jgi:Protein of unknown function (DUF1592)/Protein of unknown function (DUF1588)/Protein of unknown function (DUF1587)/Protein of unknown function (DUF1595)/Protein of unknown function (DUF1585)
MAPRMWFWCTVTFLPSFSALRRAALRFSGAWERAQMHLESLPACLQIGQWASRASDTNWKRREVPRPRPRGVSTMTTMETSGELAIVRTCCGLAPALLLALGLYGCRAEIGADPARASGGSTATGDPPIGADGTPIAGLDVNRVSIHRLNNSEYDNTMRDLLGVASTSAKTFIADEQLFGFDNIADAFGMTDAQYEQYFNSADALIEQVFADNGLRARIMICTPASPSDTSCAATIIGAFGLRAWRRPLQQAEITRLTQLASDAIAAGEDFGGGIKQVTKTMLSSLPFLYRVEMDPNPSSSQAHALDPYELASRLSYLGWSTMPDAALFSLAKSGELTKSDVLGTEVDRLLADPRSSQLVSGFAGQWLGLRDLASHQVEPTAFPDWNEPLRQAMIQEGLLYFSEFLTGPRNMTEFFSADVNVTDTGDHRQGFLGLASFLTQSSFSYRTAPTLRGKWVLENLLCEETPPPPPDVPKLDDAANAQQAMASQSENVRVRLEAHRTMAACASCHKTLDPIGLGLENFDAIGRYRSKYANGDAIDASGVLPDGATFNGLAELSTLLGKDTRLTECASKKLMTYSLSRGVVDSDAPYLKQIRDSWNGKGLKALLKLIVLNDTFRFRRGEPM